MIKAAIITVAVLACVAALWFWRSRQTVADAIEFPMIYNVANFMNTNELKEIEHTIHSRSEDYVISIAVVSSNNAQVHVGDGRFVQPRSGRVYKVSRIEGRWQIDDVESWEK